MAISRNSSSISSSIFNELGEPTVVVEPRKGLFHLNLGAAWEYRELLYFLVWREVKVRYKQTVIGAAWAIIQPLLTMLIFTVVFSMFARIPSDGVPYPIFAYAALLPWTYFSQALGRAGNSLVGDANLVKKVYFPRLIIPLSSITAPLVDFALSSLVLGGMLAWYRITPRVELLALPLFLLFAIFKALGIGLFLSALNVRYRDVGHTVPFIIQIWMYASPIAYPLSLVPEKWRFLYSLNPIVGVVEGFRWAILGQKTPDFSAIGISIMVVIIVLFGGLVFFRRMESTFADVV
jgi:lipopolysaccharide transport system permease protein